LTESAQAPPANESAPARLGAADWLLLFAGAIGAVLWWRAPHGAEATAWLAAKAAPVSALALITLRHRFRRVPGVALFAAAMGAHLVGDIALEVAPFVAGMAAFGAGHLILITLFWRRRLDLDQLEASTRVSLGALGLAGGLVLIALQQRLHGLLAVAVPVYAALLVSMAGSALLCRRGRPVLQSGAVLFVLSDSLLALGKFGGVALASSFVWPLYVAAQGAIALGWLGFAGHEIPLLPDLEGDHGLDEEPGGAPHFH
jgi:uncharacterized membrane protein YhhN